MAHRGDSDDIRAIDALMARQFQSAQWTRGRSADWTAFAADYFPGAPLYPAARPATTSTAEAFVDRMKGLAKTEMPSFTVSYLGSDIQAFGNAAVAFAAIEMVENEEKTVRGIEAFLLIKEDGAWRITSQTWDTEDETKSIPQYLLSRPV